MTNLLKETLNVMKRNKKFPEDVLWCGSEMGYFDWDKFKLLANKDYDSGYGSCEVATDLIIVGNNWWLERHEYDGSEWWEFKTVPIKPSNEFIPNTLMGGMWGTLEELNKEKK
jgi:hypothetical protein